MGRKRLLASACVGFFLTACAGRWPGVPMGPAAGPVRVGLCNVAGVEDGLRERALREMAERGARVAFLFDEAGGRRGWRCVVVGPRGEVREVPADLAAPRSRDIGPLHLTVLDFSGAVPHDVPDALRADLSLSAGAWRVVLMSRPVFGREPDRSLLSLAELFEGEGVDLVVSGDGGYVRTAPIGSMGNRAVRYVVLDGSSGGVLFGLLVATAGRVEWSAWDREGRLADLVVLPREGGEAAFVTVGEVLAGEESF